MIFKTLIARGIDHTLIVDDEDADVLEKSWYVNYKYKHQNYYTIRRPRKVSERREGLAKEARLHNEIWEKHFGPIPEGHEVDHFDYNTCNNTKSNLRLLTKKANNERARKKSKVKENEKNTDPITTRI